MKIIHSEKIKTVTFLDERYYLDEKIQAYYPSVTTITDVYPKGFGYIKWLKDLGSNSDQVLKEAGEQGTLIHDAIGSFFHGKEITWADDNGNAKYNMEQWNMLMRFYEFYKTYKPNPIAIEYSMVDGELGFGGTLDFVGIINNQVWLIDWKSSNGVYRSYELQISAYVTMWNKLNPDKKIQRFGILHLKSATRGPDKTGKVIQGAGWKLHEPEKSLDELFDFFQMTQKIWLKENPTAKPKNIVYPDRISMDKEEVVKKD